MKKRIMDCTIAELDSICCLHKKNIDAKPSADNCGSCPLVFINRCIYWHLGQIIQTFNPNDVCAILNNEVIIPKNKKDK